MAGEAEHAVEFGGGGDANVKSDTFADHPGFSIELKAVVAVVLGLIIVLIIQCGYNKGNVTTTL